MPEEEELLRSSELEQLLRLPCRRIRRWVGLGPRLEFDPRLTMLGRLVRTTERSLVLSISS